MKDINSSILQAYYELINDLDIPCYEGEEPDNVADKLYVVLSDINSSEVSTKNSSDIDCTIQISLHSWEYKYNNSKAINTATGQILEALKPSSGDVLDLSAYGLQMLNLMVQTDRTERLGELSGRIYITRILILKQKIFITS
jgi:hypothetical protein